MAVFPEVKPADFTLPTGFSDYLRPANPSGFESEGQAGNPAEYQVFGPTGVPYGMSSAGQFNVPGTIRAGNWDVIPYESWNTWGAMNRAGLSEKMKIWGPIIAGTFGVGAAAGVGAAGAEAGAGSETLSFGPATGGGSQWAEFPAWAGNPADFYPGAASAGGGGFSLMDILRPGGSMGSDGYGGSDYYNFSSMLSPFNYSFAPSETGAWSPANWGSMGLPSWAGSIAPGESGGIPDWLRRWGIRKDSPFGAGMNIFSGLYGLKLARDTRKAGEAASRRADPFGPWRPGYAAQLQNLMANPSSITTMPGYRAGLDAVERKLNSQGYMGSGNMMAALQKYGGDFFNQETARLANLAGAQFAPGGGEFLMAGQKGSSDLASRALASLGYGGRELEDILRKRGA